MITFVDKSGSSCHTSLKRPELAAAAREFQQREIAREKAHGRRAGDDVTRLRAEERHGGTVVDSQEPARRAPPNPQDILERQCADQRAFEARFGNANRRDAPCLSSAAALA